TAPASVNSVSASPRFRSIAPATQQPVQQPVQQHHFYGTIQQNHFYGNAQQPILIPSTPQPPTQRLQPGYGVNESMQYERAWKPPRAYHYAAYSHHEEPNL